MKKLLLLFAVLLTTVGVFAQVNYGKRTWTFPATDHEAVTEVPAEIFEDFATQYSGTVLTDEKVGVFVTDVRVATEGAVTATFVYNGGNVRMDIGGVDLVNANGEVVYSDYHFGFAGGQLVDNVYTLAGVAVGDYTMRVFIPAQKEDVTSATSNDSKGVLTIAGAWMYPNEGVYYNIKNVRSNKYVTFKGEGKKFTQESANNGAGSYWHFVEASLDDVKKWNNPWLEEGAIPEGVKPYWVYSAACEKGVENVSNGYMSSPSMDETYPAKIYYIGVHTKGSTTGLIFRPCHEDGSSWNDAGGNGTALGHYGSDDPGSLWSIELANVADNDLIAMGTTAKNEALATVASYEQAYYFNPTAAQISAARAVINAIDCSTIAKSLMSLIDGVAAAKVAELASCTTAPKAGDRFMMKNVGRNGGKDFLCASADGNVKSVAEGNALDCVWVLVEAEGGFKLYNEKFGVYVGALSTSNNTVMKYTSDADAAGVYEIWQTGVYTLFHAKGQDGTGYMHQSNWGSKEIVRWDNGDCSQWQLLKAPFELTTDKETPILYAIKSARTGGNYYFTLEGNNVKLVNNADIVNNDNAKWFFMLDENKNVKIYPYAGEGKTMGYLTVGDGAEKLTTDNTAADWEADTYSLYLNVNNAANYNNKYFAFRPTEGTNFVSNIYGTNSLVGFYNQYNDHGTRLGFESINEVELANKIAAWESYLAHEGDKVCQYVIQDGVQDAVNNATTVVATKSSNEAALKDVVEALRAYEFPTINLPQEGNFYRFSHNYGGEVGSLYVQAVACGVQDKGNGMLMSTDQDAKSIFYYADNQLLSYSKGLYVHDQGNARGLQAVGVAGGSARFVAGTVVGQLGIYAGDSFHANTSGDIRFIDHCGSVHNADHNFTVEEVTSLPVTISPAKYATFFAPCNVTLPEEGLKAYYVSKVGDGYASMTEITGVIPANTGVLLYADVTESTTYNLTIGGEATEVESNLMEGTVASSYVAKESYVLSMQNSVVGFYKALMNKENGAAFLNNGFKAYLPAGDNNARSLVFNFGGEETAIESVEAENGNVKAEIFDLAGRRVQNAQKGVFIVNGKVVIK